MIKYVYWEEGHYSVSDRGDGTAIDLPPELWDQIAKAFKAYEEAQRLLSKAIISAEVARRRWEEVK